MDLKVSQLHGRGKGLEFHQWRFRWENRRNFFTERVVRDWDRLPRGVVELASPGVCKRCVDVALGLVVGLVGQADGWTW